MNIAVDFDGVLFDTESWFMAYASLYNLDVKGGKVINKKNFRVQDRYNWTDEKITEYIVNHSPFIESEAPVMPMAKDVLNALSKNHKIFAISARGGWLNEEKEITLKRLEKENIHFDKVVFTNHSKVEACRELKIDLMIDDYPKVVKELAKNNVKCLYFRDLTNKKVKHKNATEVRNWGDIAVELIKLGIIEKEDLKIKI